MTTYATRQNERNAIAAYIAAPTLAAAKLASTLPLVAGTKGKLARLRKRTAGLQELAAVAVHPPRAPFQSDTEFHNELLAMRAAVYASAVAAEVQ